MPPTKKSTTRERRLDPRIPLESNVEIRIIGTRFQGPSENISSQGIFFVSEAEIPVEVTVSRRYPPLKGRIVRVQAIREDTLGIAVRFDETLPPELDPSSTFE